MLMVRCVATSGAELVITLLLATALVDIYTPLNIGSVVTDTLTHSLMDRHKSKQITNFQDKFYYDYPSYKKDERREGRARLRRSDSAHSRRDVSSNRTRDKSSDGRQGHGGVTRSGSVKRFSSQQQTHNGRDVSRDWGRTRESDDNMWTRERGGHGTRDDNTWVNDNRGHGQDRRRWGWAGADFDINNNSSSRGGYKQSRQAGNDYVDMSSMETSSTASDTSSLMTMTRVRRGDPRSHGHHGYNKIYVRHQPPVSRSRSITRPSPPRAKSVGHHSQSGYPASRTQSFTSIYETRSVGAGYSKSGTGLDLRPLRTSLSSQGIFFTETGHLPAQSSYFNDGPMSISLQDLNQSSAFTATTRYVT